MQNISGINFSSSRDNAITIKDICNVNFVNLELIFDTQRVKNVIFDNVAELMSSEILLCKKGNANANKTIFEVNTMKKGNFDVKKTIYIN